MPIQTLVGVKRFAMVGRMKLGSGKGRCSLEDEQDSGAGSVKILREYPLSD